MMPPPNLVSRVKAPATTPNTTRGMAKSAGFYINRAWQGYAQWGANALWVQKNPDPAFATALTAFNPFQGKDDVNKYSDIRAAMSAVLSALAAEDPKIYIRTVTWRKQKTDPADNCIAFRVSTHGVYNSFRQIDYMFERLVAAIEATGLPQLA
jgi:hypothetical protein